jgi:glutamate 5-kinase
LLAVGVKGVQGAFNRGELVACIDEGGREVARGLVNYDAEQTARVMGKPSAQFEQILGYIGEPELIHRDNLVLM